MELSELNELPLGTQLADCEGELWEIEEHKGAKVLAWLTDRPKLKITPETFVEKWLPARVYRMGNKRKKTVGATYRMSERRAQPYVHCEVCRSFSHADNLVFAAVAENPYVAFNGRAVTTHLILAPTRHCGGVGSLDIGELRELNAAIATAQDSGYQVLFNKQQNHGLAHLVIDLIKTSRVSVTADLYEQLENQE